MCFEAAKTTLSSSTKLPAPGFTCPFQVGVDASLLGAGVVLQQQEKYGINHPLCYLSQKLRSHQLNYSTIMEALDLLWALQYLEVYLGSNSALINMCSDHSALVFLC